MPYWVDMARAVTLPLGGGCSGESVTKAQVVPVSAPTITYQSLAQRTSTRSFTGP